MLDNQHIYSVSQLCRETRLVLEGHFLSLQIEGEISNLSRPASGHIYFTLKDNKAQVQCAMFRAQLRKIGFTPSNGSRVQLKARVSLYEPRGNFQLIAEHMEAAGEGALRLQFERLKRKLADQGLYEPQHKKPLPTLSKKVGVITSASGAAVHDILSVLNKRFPAMEVLIYPVSVQGEMAKHEIVDALALANQRKDCEVLILARGGGSLEDLWAFNEEIVALAIHQSELPVISAIGHEVDFTIADLVADLRAPTPSAAAEIISPEQQQWLDNFQRLEEKLCAILQAELDSKTQQLNTLQHRLHRSHPGAQLQLHAQRLDDCQARLLQTPKRFLPQQQLRLSQLSSRLHDSSPTAKIHLNQQSISAIQYRLEQAIENSLQQARLRFANCHKGLATLSPLATLSRGYSISKQAHDNRIINSIKQVNIGDEITIQLSDGVLSTRLEGSHENP
ncbi:MAG: exodeoxyribonuclease VII large subunit [Cycloclasticus sp.]|nr:exodeoxyribonuclease VII large subunit [Cycloclasticus sp. 46_83_sub15_T18]